MDHTEHPPIGELADAGRDAADRVRADTTAAPQGGDAPGHTRLGLDTDGHARRDAADGTTVVDGIVAGIGMAGTLGMVGYQPATYGERLAGRYDEWYAGLDDVAAVVRFLEATLPRSAGRARICELAVGTGRLALPLAARGHAVVGIDVSAAMLERLRAADPRGTVTAVLGDMADPAALPPGPFDLVFVAYNSFFMLTDAAAQQRCIELVAARLAPGAAFVVEAFVPDDPPPRGRQLTVRSMTADQVVLAATDADAATQLVRGQLIELTHGQPVQLHPYVLRYCHVDELDAMAAAAGLRLAARYGSVEHLPFDERSTRHVSIYRH